MEETMPEKRNIATFILDVLRNVVAPQEEPAKAPVDSTPAPKKKMSLNEMPLDELEKAKAMLDHEERKMMAELDEIEKKKRVLYDRAVSGKVSDAELTSISRKINDLLIEANSKTRDLQMLSKEFRTLNGLVLLKKRTNRATESALGALLGNLDLAELTTYIDKATIENDFSMKKFDDVLTALGIVDSIAPEYTEDRNVLEIKKMLQKAQSAGENAEVVFQDLSKMHQRNTEGEDPES
jgi:hypothetical protein